jgi:hypothetical protein
LIVDDDFEIFTHSALTTKRRVNFAFNGIEALEVLKNNTTIDISYGYYDRDGWF